MKILSVLVLSLTKIVPGMWYTYKERSRQAGKGKRRMKKRNIRQIGQVKGIRNIYIEDYAMSYLKQMAEPDVPYARMAVLIGEQEKGAKETAVYVYGVLDIPSGGEGVGYQMDGAAWTQLYAKMGQHFPNMEIVGWYLTGEEIIPEKSDWLLRFHRENFMGENKIFFYYNPLELEEIGYFYEEGQLKPQSGYYIFYEKNEAMQNLLVTRHQEEENHYWTGFKDGRTSSRYESNLQENRTAYTAWEEKGQYAYESERTEERGRSAYEREPYESAQTETAERMEEVKHSSGGRGSSYLAGIATAVAVLALCLAGLQYFDRLDGLEEAVRQLTGSLSERTTMGQAQTEGEGEEEKREEQKETDKTGENKQEGEDTDEREENTKENQTGEVGGGSVLEVETLPGGIIANPASTDSREQAEGQKQTEDQEQTENQKQSEEEENGTTQGKTGQADRREEDETEGIEPVEDADSEETSELENSEKAKERTDTARSQNRYIVQPGDTLSGICRNFYQDLSMLDTLMQVNQLSDPNGILEGDILILP